mmetsp:Transcript_2155/g.7440  ORF Transcript_2155/g.7440 Transcript_2155/m.7440 type:complete len:229 (+) Transcript_2155:268-954(+)
MRWPTRMVMSGCLSLCWATRPTSFRPATMMWVRTPDGSLVVSIAIPMDSPALWSSCTSMMASCSTASANVESVFKHSTISDARVLPLTSVTQSPGYTRWLRGTRLLWSSNIPAVNLETDSAPVPKSTSAKPKWESPPFLRVTWSFLAVSAAGPVPCSAAPPTLTLVRMSPSSQAPPCPYSMVASDSAVAEGSAPLSTNSPVGVQQQAIIATCGERGGQHDKRREATRA